MRSGRLIRSLAVVSSVALIFGAFVAPAEAGKKKKKKPVACPAFTPAEPETDSHEGAEALEAAVQKVTAAHTEAAPLVVEYEHGPAFWDTVTQTPVQESTEFFNFQVEGAGGLHVKAEWAAGPSDIDLYLYEDGTRVASSGSFNFVPVDASPVQDFSAGGNGGQGFETIPGYSVVSCKGLTLESRAFITGGEPVKLKVWLGEVGDNVQE